MKSLMQWLFLAVFSVFIFSCEGDDSADTIEVNLFLTEGESIQYTIGDEIIVVTLGEHWDVIRDKLGEPDLSTTYSADYWGTNLGFNTSRNLSYATLFPYSITHEGYEVFLAETSMGIKMGDSRDLVHQIYGTEYIIVAGGEEKFANHGVRFGYDDNDEVQFIWLISKN